jgi:hypothetical protein
LFFNVYYINHITQEGFMSYSDVSGPQRLPPPVEEHGRRERSCSLGDCFGRLWTWLTAPHAPEKASKTAAKVEQLADNLDDFADDDLFDLLGMNLDEMDQDSFEELVENQLFLKQFEIQLLQLRMNSLNYQAGCLTLIAKADAIIGMLEEEMDDS